MAGTDGRSAADRMIHLHDVDVVLKLAGGGLLEDLSALLE